MKWENKFSSFFLFCQSGISQLRFLKRILCIMYMHVCHLRLCGGFSFSLPKFLREREKDRPAAGELCFFSFFFPQLVYVCKRMTLRNELQTCVCVCVQRWPLTRKKCEREDRDREPNIRVNSTSPFFSRIKQKEKNATIFMTVAISPNELTWQVCRMNSNYSTDGL